MTMLRDLIAIHLSAKVIIRVASGLARSTLHIASIRTGHVASKGLSLGAVHLHIELNRLALSQRTESLGMDSGLVAENISTAIIGGDEAKALGNIEKLDSSGHTGKVSNIGPAIKNIYN
jgi:hypothetical protein